METIFSLVIWIIIAGIFWGTPTYLFAKGKTTYVDHPLQNIGCYLAGIIVAYLLFNKLFVTYLSNLLTTELLVFLIASLVWISIPFFYRNYHLTKAEKLRYQFSKYFEVLLQQVLFLAGLLIFDSNWILFGLIFFVAHLPFFFILPRKVIGITSAGSLPGGFLFGFLQSLGLYGFTTALLIHLLFYTGLSYVISAKNIDGFYQKR